MEETFIHRMEDQLKSRQRGQSQNFFNTDLDPAELQRILERIEENLAFRQILKEQAPKPHGPEGTPTLPPLPSVFGIDTRLQYMRLLRAPLFGPVVGRWLLTLVCFILNIPIRLFGRKQIMFNNELLALLSDMALLFHALSERAEVLASWTVQLQNMAERQQRIEEGMAEHQRGTGEWIRLVQADVQDVAFEVREIKSDFRQPLASGGFSVPVRRSKLTGLQKELKVNLGCGHRPMDGYVNVDFRAVPEADIAAEVRSLPFQAGSIAELASSHLIEHFREYEFKTRILPYWHTLLKPSGVLRIICPNWEAMVHQLQAGDMTWAHFKEITFGGQEYEGNDHFSMYTPASLTALLQENGFSQVEIVATDRDNGGCPEMELVAIKD